MPFTKTITDNLSGKDSATIGNNWTDVNGGVFSIVNNKLVGTANTVLGYTTNFLIRPASGSFTAFKLMALGINSENAKFLANGGN